MFIILGDVVCGTRREAVPVGVITGNSPHRHRQLRSRGGSNME